MNHQPEPLVEEVDEATLRHYYNNIGHFERRIERGEAILKVMPGSERDAPPRLNEQPGTKSRMVLILDSLTGSLLVKAHEYIRTDGSLGGSGKRDPKWIRRADGTIIKQRRKRRPRETGEAPAP